MDDKRWEIGGLIAVGVIIVIVILNLIKQERRNGKLYEKVAEQEKRISEIEMRLGIKPSEDSST